MKRSTKKQILSMLIIVSFLGSSITYAFISTVPTSNQVQQNWAARVQVVIYNQLNSIPAGLGIVNNTTSKIFTTSNDNIIYKTGEQDVRLSDLFEIWNKTFNSTCIFDYCDTNTSSMRMYVNGAENFDYELYVIQNNDDILIDYR
jgi:hypothetical protein